MKNKKIRNWLIRIICVVVIFFLSFHICFAIQKIYELVFANNSIRQYREQNKQNELDPADDGNTSSTSSKSSNISDADDSPWYLILVNAENPLPSGYQIEITHLKNNQAIDSRCYPDLQEMMDNCRKEGLDPLICSSYRSSQKQKKLFQEEMNQYLSAGYSEDYAYDKASQAVAVPGTSEHELGLAVDIVDSTNQKLDSSQERTKVQKWLMKNSWKYGFVLRYPSDKSDITGIMYEPWHYRYVGKEAAKFMYENDLCLEEYKKTGN